MEYSTEYEFDEQDSQALQTAGKWAQFIGIIFIFISLITLITFIFLLSNDRVIAKKLMEINRMSTQAVELFMTGGKIIFGFAMLVAVSVMTVNAYWLIKFNLSIKAFRINHNEEELNDTFSYLTKYLKITFILGCVYFFVSVIAVLFSVRI
jgi:hypothetical protein